MGKSTIKFILYLAGFVPCWFYCQSLYLGLQKTLKEGWTTIRNDLKRYFEYCQVEGSIVIYDYLNKNWILSVSIHNPWKRQNGQKKNFNGLNSKNAVICR